MSTLSLHELAEERSLALHAAVADRLREDPSLLDRARDRVDGWLRDHSVHPRYARAWRDLLERPVQEVVAAIVDTGETARALRQSSPFAGVLDPRTRWRILAEVRERHGV